MKRFGLAACAVALVAFAAASTARAQRQPSYAVPTPTPIGTAQPTPTPSPSPSPTPAPTASPTPVASVAPGFLQKFAPAATAAPQSNDGGAPASGGPDAGYQLVGGAWNCVTFAGDLVTHVFSRARDGVSIDVASSFQIGTEHVPLTEQFIFHPKTRVWEAVLAGGKFHATARPWTDPTQPWTFIGKSTETGSSLPVEMTIEFLGPQAFRRDFARFEGDRIAPYAGETCRRTL